MIKKFFRTFCIALIATLSLNSCKTKLIAENDFLPEIINPTIKSYDLGTEKGYLVEFETSNSDFVPSGVVVYKIKSDLVVKDSVNENLYRVNVIHQTQQIQNYKPTAFNQPNGILFFIDGTYYLKKVNFKKK